MKIIYSILEARHAEQKIQNKKRKPVTGKSAPNSRAKKNKRSSKLDDSEESDDFSLDEEDYDSDDSRCGKNQA